MDETGDHQVKQNKPDWERRILLVLSHMQDLDPKEGEWCKCKTGTVQGWEPVGR
jgi:hypothetical protein